MAIRWILHLGDSLSTGFPGTHGLSWPEKARGLKEGTGWGIDSHGVAGERLDQINTRYTSYLRNKGHTHVSIWGGINDVLQDTTAATAYARLLTIANAAIADGQSVIVCTLSPFRTYSGYTAGRETQRLAFNVLVRAAVQPGGDLAGQTLVDMDVALRDPGDVTLLLVANDSGDHLHFSSTGETVAATAYVAAVP